MVLRIVAVVPETIDLALEPILGDKNAVQLAVERLQATAARVGGTGTICSMVGSDRALAAADGSVPKDWIRKVVETPRQISSVLAAIRSTAQEQSDTLLVAWLDQPCLHPELAVRLVALHEEWWCDYTFADGFPAGLAPEIVRAEALGAMTALAGDSTMSRTFLFDTIQKDINAFDIETDVSEVDLRAERIVLSADSRRNAAACRRLLALPAASVAETVEAVRSESAIQRTLPAWYDIQVTDAVAQDVVYEPWGRAEGDGTAIDSGTFAELVNRIQTFTPAATISIGHGGEPALHPDIVDIVETLIRSDMRFFIETSGVGWRSADVERLEAGTLGNGAIIIFLDADDPGIYHALRGDGFEEAHHFTERMVARFKDACYVQATRLPESEEHLREFYHAWKERCTGVIIEKHNDYAGRLPQRRVADLSPIHRHACRHLQRDMVILADGSVPRCMQDLDRASLRGNVFDTPLETVWQAGDEEYARQVQQAYAPLCEKCDEFYTVNG